MKRLLGLFGDIFWSAVMVLVFLAVGVLILRVSRNKLPATGGFVNTVARATGLNA